MEKNNRNTSIMIFPKIIMNLFTCNFTGHFQCSIPTHGKIIILKRLNWKEYMGWEYRRVRIIRTNIMRTYDGCGLGLHVLPCVERTTIRARQANKRWRNIVKTLFLQYLLFTFCSVVVVSVKGISSSINAFWPISQHMYWNVETKCCSKVATNRVRTTCSLTKVADKGAGNLLQTYFFWLFLSVSRLELKELSACSFVRV